MIGAIVGILGNLGLSAQKSANDQYMLGRAENAAELNNALAWQYDAAKRRNLFITIGIALAAIALLVVLTIIIINSSK